MLSTGLHFASESTGPFYARAGRAAIETGMGQTLELAGAAQTLPVSRAKPANRAAIAHATNGPFWVTHCSMANEMGSGSCGRLIARANFLRFQATWLRAALRPPLLRRGWACFRKRRRWRLIDGRSRGDDGREARSRP